MENYYEESRAADRSNDSSRNLTRWEAHTLCEAGLVVPPDWRLPGTRRKALGDTL
jgi:hypothetical protein